MWLFHTWRCDLPPTFSYEDLVSDTKYVIPLNISLGQVSLSRQGKAGQVPVTLHTVTSRIWELGCEGKKEAWTITTTAKCRDFLEMICARPEQWHFSQTNVDPAAHKLMFQFKWLILKEH